MACTSMTVKGYTIIRIISNGQYVFQVWRDLEGKRFKTENDKSYFSDAANYVAMQNGIDGEYRIGYVEALMQIYENN